MCHPKNLPYHVGTCHTPLFASLAPRVMKAHKQKCVGKVATTLLEGQGGTLDLHCPRCANAWALLNNGLASKNAWDFFQRLHEQHNGYPVCLFA
eukprot:1146293-Pelagomonas_calceolata.AAC.5